MSGLPKARPCRAHRIRGHAHFVFFERAGAYASCLRFSVYAVPLYFLIIQAMHGHTSVKFHIIKSMSTCVLPSAKTAQADEMLTITQTSVSNLMSLCRESALFCVCHRSLNVKILHRLIQNVYNHADD